MGSRYGASLRESYAICVSILAPISDSMMHLQALAEDSHMYRLYPLGTGVSLTDL